MAKPKECDRCEEEYLDPDHVCEDLEELSPDARAIVLALEFVGGEIGGGLEAISVALTRLERDR